jgi:integrase/recombinase XerD
MGESGGELAPRPPTDLARVDDVDPDQQLVKLWLHGRSRHTQSAYRRNARRFFAFVGKQLRQVQLGDLQAYADHLLTLDLADGSRHGMMAAVKSLFAFGARVGYLQFNVATVLHMPAGKDTLNERILSQDDVDRLIGAGSSHRNRVMLRFIYDAGVRVDELVSLCWKDAQARGSAGQVTVFGKGRKTRSILLEPDSFAALLSLRAEPRDPNQPIFLSRRGGKLNRCQVLRIVKAAAKKAGINEAVSPHWLRHCHASHSLDGGAPIHLVQQTLGHSSVATTSRYLHARPNESSSKFLRRRQ